MTQSNSNLCLFDTFASAQIDKISTGLPWASSWALPVGFFGVAPVVPVGVLIKNACRIFDGDNGNRWNLGVFERGFGVHGRGLRSALRSGLDNNPIYGQVYDWTPGLHIPSRIPPEGLNDNTPSRSTFK